MITIFGVWRSTRETARLLPCLLKEKVASKIFDLKKGLALDDQNIPYRIVIRDIKS